MATQAQIEANRRNAQRSTGPRTPEGKATVAQNAIKYGLFCRNLLLRNENPQELDALRASVFDRLKPADAFEALYAERIVVAAWKLQRALEAEHKLSRGNDMLSTFDLIKVYSGELDTLHRQQIAYERAMDRALVHLQKLQKRRSESQPAPEDDLELQNHENKPNSDPAAGPPASAGGDPETTDHCASARIEIVKTNPIPAAQKKDPSDSEAESANYQDFSSKPRAEMGTPET